MAQVTSYDGVPIVDAIVIGPDGQPGYSQTAQLGQPGFSNVIVDDPLGSMTFETWKDWTVDENDCTFERLYTGIVYAIRVDRGPYRDGPGRKWYLDIVDMGQLLKQRVISGADGQRPFEMDTTRINWLYNSDYLDGLVFDNGFLNVTDNPQGQFDADHRFEYPMDVFVSVAGPISKHAFVYWDAVAEQPSIFYDRFDVSLGAAGIGFSNVMSDVDEATVFYPKVDAEATYDGEDRYGGLMLGWRGPPVYHQLGTTITDMGRIRDVPFQTDRIGLASTANSVTDLLLAQHADDLVSIKFSAQLPSSVVNLARPGQTMEVRFEHIPGFETTQEVFIRSTIVQQIIAGRYLVQYDVAPNPTVPLVPTGGDPGDLPQIPPCDVENVALEQEKYMYATETGSGPWTYTGAWDSSPTAGRLLVASFLMSNGNLPSTKDVDGWNFQAEGMVPSGDGQKYVSMWTKIAEADEPTTVALVINGTGFGGLDVRLQLQQWAGVDTVDTVAVEEDITPSLGQVFVTITPTSGLPFALLVASSGIDGNVSNLGTMPGGIPTLDDEVHPVVHETWNILHRVVEDTTGSYVMGTDRTTGANGVVVALSLICSGSEQCPATGQQVLDEFVADGDGTTTNFFTRCPYADGSLAARVDGHPIIAGLTEIDGETGEFSLDFAPLAAQGDAAAEQLYVDYQGR